MNKVMYEFETNRMISSPRKFHTWVKNELKKRTGVELEAWMDDFGTWSDPVPVNRVYENALGDGKKEICKMLPYEWQLYRKGEYNFIMEWDDGHGYCYIVEFER